MYNELTLVQKGSEHYIDSREVAALVDKPHNDLMKSIRKFCEYLNEGKFPLVDFFVGNSYVDVKGEIRPCYLLTKMGCEMLANKLSGKKGIQFTAAYISKFNMMETYLKSEREREMPLKPTLSDCNDTAKIVIDQLKRTGATTHRILDFLDELYSPLGIEVVEAGELGDVPQTYTALQMAYILGVYSLYGKPHAHAVSCIVNENLFIGGSHARSVSEDYTGGAAGGYRYDGFALDSVGDWLCECKYPHEIYGETRTYHVVYREKHEDFLAEKQKPLAAAHSLSTKGRASSFDYVKSWK